MYKGTSSFLLLVVFVALLGTSASPAATRSREMIQTGSGLPGSTNSLSSEAPRVPPGEPTAGAKSSGPGALLANTYYDLQQYGSMGRMLDWGTHGSPLKMNVHFTWAHLASLANLGSHQWGWGVHATDEYSLLGMGSATNISSACAATSIDVTNRDQAVVGVNSLVTYYHWTIYRQNTAGQNGMSSCDNWDGGWWPKIQVQEGPTDTVLHCLVRERTDSLDDPGQLMYYRSVGIPPNCTWDSPVRIIDTIFNYAYDVAASRSSGEVALVWLANVPAEGDCDTCSNNDGAKYPTLDNDLYCQKSGNYGVSFSARVNVTNSVSSQSGYRPGNEVSALFDSNTNLHIVWPGRVWPGDVSVKSPYADPAPHGNCRLFHWSESNPVISTIHDADWDQVYCSGGRFSMNVAKMTISECNGRFYVIFVQFNDAPSGRLDDCAARASQGDPTGAANGDIFLSVSGTGGLTWDAARNLTNSYSPGCDSVGGSGGPCESDQWPSMAQYGTDFADDWPLVPTVDPSGTYTQAWRLDVQYLRDAHAGAAPFGEGPYTQNNLRWFRLACVPEVTAARIFLRPHQYLWPTWAQQGIERDTTLVIENIGNTTLNYSIIVQIDNGPSGWLAVNPSSGSVSANPSGSAQVTVRLNANGIVNSPGTDQNLSGRLIISHNASGSPDTVPVQLMVRGGAVGLAYDTIFTDVTSLAVANNGNFGYNGARGVNMDFFNYGDCEDLYLFDGSPVVGWIDGTDTMMNWSVFGTGPNDSCGWIPDGTPTPVTDAGDYLYYSTGRVLSRDSSLGIDVTWYAPPSTLAGDYPSLVQRLRVYSRSGTTPALCVGNVLDWDIPADTPTHNASGFDVTRQLIYQQGADYDITTCQTNNRRWGGARFLKMYLKTGSFADLGSFYGMQTLDNATWVHPQGALIPAELFGVMKNVPGYSIFSSGDPDSLYTDLFTVQTYTDDFVLDEGETLVVYNVFTTLYNSTLTTFKAFSDNAKNWFNNHIDPTAVGLCGDVDDNGSLNLNDFTYLMSHLAGPGPVPPSLSQADVDGYQNINFPDAARLLSNLFQGGTPALACPPTNGPLTGSPGLTAAMIVHDTSFPAGAESVTLSIRLKDSMETHTLMLPMLFRVDGQIPDSITLVNNALQEKFVYNGSAVDNTSGMFLAYHTAATADPLPADPTGTTVLDSIFIWADPVPYDRTLRSSYTTWGTVISGQKPFYPLLVQPNMTAWVPTLPEIPTTLRLVRPLPGEIFFQQRDYLLLWDKDPEITAVDIDLSVDNGLNWTPVASSITANEYLWHVTQGPTDEALLRISQTGNPAIQDVTDGTFIINPHTPWMSWIPGYDLSGGAKSVNGGDMDDMSLKDAASSPWDLDLVFLGADVPYVRIVLSVPCSPIPGSGACWFEDTVHYAFYDGAGTTDLSLGDFNRDGHLDIATVNDELGTVRVHFGYGDGTVTIAPNDSSFAVPGLPTYVETEDFNQDGNPDLVVTCNQDASVRLLLGNGAGGFSPPTVISTAAGGPTLPGHIDADGRPDLVWYRDDMVFVSRSSGAGTFLPPDCTYVAGTVADVVITDFNLDGQADLGVVYADETARLTTLLNDGGTGFTAQSYPTQAGYHTSAAVGDFTADGEVDVVIASRQSNSLIVMPGISRIGGKARPRTAGDPLFGYPYMLSAPGGPADLFIMDMNNDGWPDIIAANEDSTKPSHFQTQLNSLISLDLNVTSPNGGEALPLGLARPLTWTHGEGIVAVDIDLSRDGGTTWERIARNVSGTSFSWIPTPPATTTALLRLSDATVYTRRDQSNAMFTIGGCCSLRGDFNDDGSIKVSDLTALISFLFRGGQPPSCPEHGDTNADGLTKVNDLTLLIGYLFRSGPAPASC